MWEFNRLMFYKTSSTLSGSLKRFCKPPLLVLSARVGDRPPRSWDTCLPPRCSGPQSPRRTEPAQHRAVCFCSKAGGHLCTRGDGKRTETKLAFPHSAPRHPRLKRFWYSVGNAMQSVCAHHRRRYESPSPRGRYELGPVTPNHSPHCRVWWARHNDTFIILETKDRASVPR